MRHVSKIISRFLSSKTVVYAMGIKYLRYGVDFENVKNLRRQKMFYT